MKDVAHETLVERLAQVEAARGKLDRQATQLRAAHALNELAQRNRDLGAMLEALTNALVSEAGFVWAEIKLADPPSVTRSGAEEHGAPLTRELTGRTGQVIGEVAVVPRADADRTERGEMLGLLTPVLASVLDNAIYQRDLALRLHRAEQLSTLAILTSGFAHELRNPANGIVNAIEPLTQLLPRELTRPEGGVGQLLEVMAGCAEQIGFLSRQLLSFRNSGLQLDLRSTAVGELLRRALALAHRALDGVEVRADLESDCTLLCAPPLMIQVLTNLIENAGHAAGAGGWIEIDGRSAGGQITVEVADSGPGVPIELRDRVFEPFFTTKPPGAGSGLGLPLARAIVMRHGGILEIRERGAKPIFVVELPHAVGGGFADAAR